MKNLRDYILEEANKAEVFAVYFGDGTMYNYFYNEKDAKEAADKLNKEMPSNKCVVKKEAKKQKGEETYL